MRGKVLLCLLALCLLVGAVNADTLIIYPSADAMVYRNGVDETFASIIAGAGVGISTTSNSTIFVESHGSTANHFDQNDRYVIVFNGSSLNDTAIISSAVIRLYGDNAKSATLGSTNFGAVFCNASPTSLTSLAKEDYNKIGNTLFSDIIPYASLTNETNNNFTLNAAGIANINKTGLFAVGYKNTWDLNASFGGSWAAGKSSRFSTVQSSWTGTSLDPYLEITYTLPDTTPPASITNLANDTATCEQINFTWTNPADADFNGTEFWLDNDYLGNLTLTTTFGLFSGLEGGTSYTFSTKTFDLTGNLNASFVNMTAISSSCTVVASFTKNQTSGVAPLAVAFTDTSTGSPDAWNWSYSEERVTNGGFESGWDEWSHGSGWYYTTDFPHTGILTSEVAGTGLLSQNVNFTGVSQLTWWNKKRTASIVLNVTIDDTLISSESVSSTEYVQKTIDVSSYSGVHNLSFWTHLMTESLIHVDDISAVSTTYFSTEQNPVYTFPQGNYSIALNASNSAGYNITPGAYWVNVSAAPPGGCGLICKMIRYFWQFRLLNPLVMT